jgi:ATP-dependent Clp protease protease subunit
MKKNKNYYDECGECGNVTNFTDVMRRQTSLKARELYLFDEIAEVTMEILIEDLLLLDSDKDKRPITVFLNSPGGNIGDGFALIDIIKNASCPIRIVGVGEVASMASAIFVVGTKGLRLIGKNAYIMFHPIMTGNVDYIKFAKSRLKQTEELEELYDNIVLSHTGLPKEEYKKCKDTELWLKSKEVLEYGIADKLYIGRDWLNEEKNK